jgi:hypothetical protein
MLRLVSSECWRDITDNYIESQKEIIKSTQGAWKPYLGNTNGMYCYSRFSQ